MLESKIQSQITNKAKANGWMVVKLIQTPVTGVPDLMLLKDGITRFIEVKRPGNKPTELQKHIHNKLIQQGFLVEVIDNVNDFIA